MTLPNEIYHLPDGVYFTDYLGPASQDEWFHYLEAGTFESHYDYLEAQSKAWFDEQRLRTHLTHHLDWRWPLISRNMPIAS